MKFERLNNNSDILELIQFHNQSSEIVVLDVETTSTNPRQAQLLDLQISGQKEDEAVIFSAEKASLLTNLSERLVLVAHNYKYDAHVLFRHGVDLLDRCWRDTLLLGHLVDENRESYSLDSYVKEYWNDNYKEEFWAKYNSYAVAPEEEKVNYACRDILFTGQLFRKMQESLRNESIPDSLSAHVHKLQASLLRTEISGIRVDLDYIQELGARLKRRIYELKPQMRSLVEPEVKLIELMMWTKEMSVYKTDKGKAGCKRPEFSFESSKQLQELLYGQLGLPVQKNEKTKSISTDYASLSKIEDQHPVVKLIQENRELQKVYTAYIEGTLDRIDQERVYPEFRVAGTVTGRLAHSNPNLAQLPKTGGVRAIYVPDRGCKLISADYSQLEVVIEANLTGDKNLIRMFENGESKHDLTARELGCSRDTAKTLNFALQYWCSHYKVAKLLGVSNAEGLLIYNKYWMIYKGPKRLKDTTDKLVNDGLPIVSPFGRKRRFRQIERQEWDSDYRQAYNFLIQSTGADITSKAFWQLSDTLWSRSLGRTLFSVHDEILIESKPENIEEAETLLIATMESVGSELGFKIPLKAESSGPQDRWED